MSAFTIARRTHSVIYAIISANLATLRELRDDYDIDETLDLYEIALTSLHNKAINMKGE